MSQHNGIGGYFGLELDRRAGQWHQAARRFQSARAAFLSLLRIGRPARVWIPWFVCDNLLEPLRMSGVRAERYSIDDSLTIDRTVRVGADDWLLYVNYFGLRDAEVVQVLMRFPPQRVIIDNAQAFYSMPHNCLATIYSPRKYFAVPDGGLLFTNLDVQEPERMDHSSLARCSHLLIRASEGPEAGYDSFVAAEKSLALQEPLRMSRLTAAMLGSIDFKAAQNRRRDNFSRLHAALNSSNLLNVELDKTSVPLCYPYRTSRSGLREALISARVFVPTYWPEVAAGASDIPASDRALATEILPIPCDQRYSSDDMDTILDVMRRQRDS